MLFYFSVFSFCVAVQYLSLPCCQVHQLFPEWKPFCLLHCFSFLTFFPTVSISLLIFHLIFHVIHLFYQTLQHKCITNSCFKFLFRQLQHVFFFFFSFIFISWRLITLQYCSGFCHTLTWISHGFTCIPHPDPPSHLPLYPIPLGLPSAPSICFIPEFGFI